MKMSDMDLRRQEVVDLSFVDRLPIRKDWTPEDRRQRWSDTQFEILAHRQKRFMDEAEALNDQISFMLRNRLDCRKHLDPMYTAFAAECVMLRCLMETQMEKK